MKAAISLVVLGVLWTAVSAEIRLQSPFNKQQFTLPSSAVKPKCREHPAAHIDFKWLPVGSRSYVLTIEKQSIDRHEDGFERIRYDPLIKSDETSTTVNRYFYDRGIYRWSVMGRNAKGDLDRESQHYYFTIV